MEERHFWFVGRRALVTRMLARHRVGRKGFIADLACGTGFMLNFLASRGYHGIGIDLHAGRHGNFRNRHGLRMVRADVNRLPLKQDSCAGVVLLDVLEHVDDTHVLGEACRVLQPGGWVLVSVPAGPWLWSRRDEAAGHLRRYTRSQLLARLEEALLDVVEIRYYQFFLFPLIAASRILGRRGNRLLAMEEHPLSYFNTMLAWINAREAGLSDILRWPWGSSLAALCRKRGAA
jgi:SAM-dependent methyltransferase